MSKYFGTDGIRGITNKELTGEIAYKVGKILSIFKINKIIIGQDSRISSPLISYSLISGALSMGINVYDEGLTSTPSIAFLSKKYNSIGVMISASHNPYYYNGIKIFINGNKLSKKEEELIEKQLNDYNLSYSNSIGRYNKSNLKDNYLNYLEKFIEKYSDLRIGLDLANGSNSIISYKIFKNITNSLYISNELPDGYNINDKCGSTYIDNLYEYSQKHNLDISFSYDGDGDRVIAIYKNRILTGNTIIFILAHYFFDYLGYQRKMVVLTKDTNLGVINSFIKHDIEVILSDIGDNNVRRLMDEHKAILGGEDSGHIITPYSRYGDGILTSLILLTALDNIDISLINEIEEYPYIKENINKYDKDIVNNTELINYIDRLKDELKTDGTLLVRKSGTENLIRIYICHKNRDLLNKYYNGLIKEIERIGKKYER